MANTYTSNVNIAKPATNDTGWGTTLNANADAIDSLSAVGALAVKLAETPSSTLNLSVSAGTFRKSDGTRVAFAGNPTFAVGASATSRIWLTDAGILTSGGAFPADSVPHVRLATVVAGVSTISSITDAREPWASAASPLTSGASQVAIGALTTQALTDSTGGTPSTTLAAITDTATKNAVASLAAQLANVLADLNSLKTLANAERLAAVAAGTMKGSA